MPLERKERGSRFGNMVNHGRLCQEIGSSSQTPTGEQKEVWPKVKLSAHASHREPVEGLKPLISSNSRNNAAADATVCLAAAMISPYGQCMI